jgi:hypothetical protein
LSASILPFGPGLLRLRAVIRRLVSLLLAVAMLHLTVARVDAACAMHDGAATQSSHEGMQHGDADAPAEKAPCETPAAPDCCQALASCAPVLSIAEGADVITPLIVHATIAAAVSERPLSRSTAPEPPPPKA